MSWVTLAKRDPQTVLLVALAVVALWSHTPPVVLVEIRRDFNVDLVDEPIGIAFDADVLRPGEEGAVCVNVSTKNHRSDIAMFGIDVASTKSLSDSIKIHIDVSASETQSSVPSCDLGGDSTTAFVGTLAEFGHRFTSPSKGLEMWSAQQPSTRTVRLRYWLDYSAPSSLQGGVASITFVWADRLRG